MKAEPKKYEVDRMAKEMKGKASNFKLITIISFALAAGLFKTGGTLGMIFAIVCALIGIGAVGCLEDQVGILATTLDDIGKGIGVVFDPEEDNYVVLSNKDKGSH
jgi:hypothetical protein